MFKIQSLLDYIVEKTSGEIFNPPRNKEIHFDYTKYPELADEFFDLIQTAYAEIGGHLNIQKPEDVFADKSANWWAGVDLHGSKDFDLIMFGKKTKYGVKFAGVGHDGTKDAKRKYIEKRADDLSKPGFYLEVSDKISQILIAKYGVPEVEDQAVVTRVLGKDIEWHGKHPTDSSMKGNSWYTRKIAGQPHSKILLGRPKI